MSTKNEDIQVIGKGFQKGSFEVLPESIDRFHACRYFCTEVQRYSTLKDETKARWYLHAALCGFRSVLDSLDGEIKINWRKIFGKEVNKNEILINTF
jgi:hypothetical protein